MRCATGGAPGRARRLLGLNPRIANASLYTNLVLGDAAALAARLRDDPELASKPGGPHQWVPLLYACHTCMARDDRARLAGLVEIVRDLCAGADPNAEYHWNWHPELPRTALWASVCEVEHLPMAEVLRAGANPTDGVTGHIAAGGERAGVGAAASVRPESKRRSTRACRRWCTSSRGLTPSLALTGCWITGPIPTSLGTEW
ncbi:MAG: hypothetical protein U0163_03555 [Gemmatimonadaceae bacterium]